MVDEDELLNSQRASVFAAAVEVGFDPARLKWIRTDRGPSRRLRPALQVVGTPYLFIFDQLKNNHACHFSPGRDTPWETQLPGPWSGQLGPFRGWLRNVERELGVEDPWAVLESADNIALAPADNSPFTHHERRALRDALDRVVAQLEQGRVGAEDERRAVATKFDELKQAADRVGRKDWWMMLLGGLTGLALDRLATGPTLNAAWSLLKAALAELPKLIGS